MASIPKVKDKTLAQERDAKRRGRETHERDEKTQVRERDRRCRWPHCRKRWPLEVAHLQDKGMGGDHGLRTRRDKMVMLCDDHHRGVVSLHTKRLRIDVLTEAGTDGILRFMRRERLTEPFVEVATEERPGRIARRFDLETT